MFVIFEFKKMTKFNNQNGVVIWTVLGSLWSHCVK